MHILLTGGTGLMGRRLCARWRQAGHRLTVFSRRPQQVESLCGVDRFDEYGDQPLDAVVNLAGEPIADKPWSHKRKALLWESRVRLTERLVEWLDAREQRPDLLLSGSAVGWYGDSGERPVTEEGAAAGEDFASELCLAWEQIALEAEKLGTRVVLLRTGLVLAPEGGFLGRLLPLYRLGLGGPLGDGRQWMPWIHIEDQIELIDFLLRRPDASGPYNACAPNPVRNRDFAKALGRALHKPARIPTPGFVLRLGLGEMSGLLLGGQRALPQRLQDAGYRFQFTDLDVALADVLDARRKDQA
ncbi:TIGR01777 family oxidoreductase [Pseudomonas aeruginosa]